MGLGARDRRPALPVWLPVFGLMFPSIVGGGILALPIALDPLGPVAAVVATITIGLVNVVTVAALAMAFARFSRSTASGSRLGALVTHRINSRVGLLTVVMVVIQIFNAVIIYCLGLSQSLASLTPLAAPAWAAITMATCAFVVLMQWRRAVEVTGTAVSFINVALLAILILAIGIHVQSDYVFAPRSEPLLSSSALMLVFGSLIFSFYGHSTVAAVAPRSLRADPSGRALITGVVVSMLAATALNSAWVFVTLGSTPEGTFGSQDSTGILQLQQIVGPIGGTLATAFVVLSLGGGTLIMALVLGDIAVERLPVHRGMTTRVGPGTDIAATDGPSEPRRVSLRIGWARDGSGLVARASDGGETATEPISGDRWDAAALMDRVGGARRGRWLQVHIDERTDSGWTIRASTTMNAVITHRATSATSRLADDDRLVASILRELTRAPQSAQSLAHTMGLTEDGTVAQLRLLEDSGIVTPLDDGTWRTRLGARRHSKGANVSALAASYESDRLASRIPTRSPSWISSPITARITAALPILVILAVVLVLMTTDSTFTSLASLLGIAIMLYIATTVSLLLGAISFRSRDTVGPRSRWVPRPAGLFAVLGAMLTVCAIYAIRIYTDPIDRIGASLGVLLSLAALSSAWRSGALKWRTVVCVQSDPDRKLAVDVLEGSQTRAAVSPTRLPQAGTDFDIELPDGVTGPLRVLAPSQDGTPMGLGGFRLTWSDGSLASFEPPPIEGVDVPIAGPSGPLRIRWTAT